MLVWICNTACIIIIYLIGCLGEVGASVGPHRVQQCQPRHCALYRLAPICIGFVMGPYVIGSFCAGLLWDGSFCDGSLSDGTLCRGTGFPVGPIRISVDGRLSSLVDPE